ncbi:MAG: metal-dependent transcriptional regulator [Actinomycetota bacterium]
MPELATPKSAGRPERTSESEEMYLITVARAVEEGRSGPIPLGVIAETLGLSVASANEMVRKLARRGLLGYEPYRGVELTDRGRRVADRVLRTRRLWSTFLAGHLGLGPMAADDQACHLEHVTTPDAADRLAEFLGDPQSDPLGRPIPSPTFHQQTSWPDLLLDDAAVGEMVEVVSVGAAPRVSKFLSAEGIVPGARLTVVGGGTKGVLIDSGGPVVLAREVARTIEIRLVGSADAD